MHTPFPSISHSYIQSCQFSAWYPTFARISPRATIIRPLSVEFRQYLQDDRVVVPDGSEDYPIASSLSDKSSSDTEESDDDATDTPIQRYAFPELDAQIRDAIERYGAVFPKLNWTSPKDASWILPALKCTSPVDVYLLLKSSDFISHDLDPSSAFDGCSMDATDEQAQPFDLELVLKKWYAVDHGREFRCFVRDEILLGISQRDPNYYPHLNEDPIKNQIISTVSDFWLKNIKDNFQGGDIFDVHLTRDVASAHLLDINPYHPKTDPLLFTYDELLEHLVASAQTSSSAAETTRDSCSPSFTPVLHVITSPDDPTATRNSPANQHNAVPFEALQISAGNDIAEFARRWEETLKQTQESGADSNDEA